MNSPETELILKYGDEFLTSNAEYFIQSFVILNELFESSGQMNIISQEKKFTVAIGMKAADYTVEMDVECVLLKPNQRSIRDCINIVAHK